MFNGTLRYNLDPENVCDDDELQELLTDAGLDEVVSREKDGIK